MITTSCRCAAVQRLCQSRSGHGIPAADTSKHGNLSWPLAKEMSDLQMFAEFKAKEGQDVASSSAGTSD